ncbi:MAG TPA: hypothetical protein VMZ52_07285 [Bryobacteraceae bacterium]|nr:hypothetical protein [Bryobacteraceae bacterium]
MRYCFGMFLTLAAFGQQSAPIGILRGDLVGIQSEKTSGELSVRSASDQVYTCRFDAHTYVERDNQRFSMGGLRAGDRLEIIADHKTGTANCYARTVHVLENTPANKNPGYRVNLRPFRNTIDNIFPRGNLLFAGVVLRMNPEMMVLRTRQDGEKTILLRQDTRYLDSGLPSVISALPVNTRVSVRGGRNLEDELEAYQVIWGVIPGPRSGQ